MLKIYLILVARSNEDLTPYSYEKSALADYCVTRHQTVVQACKQWEKRGPGKRYCEAHGFSLMSLTSGPDLSSPRERDSSGMTSLVWLLDSLFSRWPIPGLTLSPISFNKLSSGFHCLLFSSRKNETTKICSKHFVLFRFRVFVIHFFPTTDHQPTVSDFQLLTSDLRIGII